MSDKPATDTVVGTRPPKSSTAVVRRERKTPAARGKRSVSTKDLALVHAGGMEGLLALALREKSPVEALERLLALKEREDAKTAAQAFFAARAAFQAECPPIQKAAKVDYVSRDGARVKYNYAPLDDIDAIVKPICSKQGLSYTWNTVVEGQLVNVTCTLRHVGGHSEPASFSCPSTSKAGMSDQQKVGAAVKYAMRWSLIQVLGLITTEDDTDTAEVDPTPINADQLVTIEDLLETRKKSWRNPDKRVADFLAYMGVAKLAEIRETDYDRAVEALKPKEETA